MERTYQWLNIVVKIKILVDCRMINASGIGVYTREIIKELKKI